MSRRHGRYLLHLPKPQPERRAGAPNPSPATIQPGTVKVPVGDRGRSLGTVLIPYCTTKVGTNGPRSISTLLAARLHAHSVCREITDDAEVYAVAADNKLLPNWKDFLWPLGGTVFGLLVMPVAIAQYPDFFNENEWILPYSVATVVLCWIVPLILHDRTRKLYSWITSFGRLGYLLFVGLCLIAVIGIAFAGRGLLRFHRQHLARIASRKIAENSTPSPESVPVQQGPSIPVPDHPEKLGHEKTKLPVPSAERGKPMTGEAAVKPPDPDAQLLDRAVEVVGHCHDFQIAFIKKYKDVQLRIQVHDSQPGITEESKRQFSGFELGVLQKEEMQLYHQVYKAEFMELRRLLVPRVPDAAEVAVEYDDPGNMGGVTGVCSDLQNLSEAVVNRQTSEGKLTTAKASEYMNRLLPGRPHP